MHPNPVFCEFEVGSLRLVICFATQCPLPQLTLRGFVHSRQDEVELPKR